jgi:integrase
MRDVLIALTCTGLRISELAGLRWADIDLAAGTIRLTDESTRAPRRSRRKARETKSGRSHSFPIHEALRPVLKRLPRHDDNKAFHGPKGSVLEPDRVHLTLVRDVLEPLSDRFATVDGEIGFEDGRLHSFRHNFCSTCANACVPQQVVMKWLGHRDSAMVQHYYHLHDSEAQRQMKRLDFLGRADCGVAGGD